ncbi:hypothetical protein ACS2UU_27255 [Bacillus cereus group sp. BC254]|uniref:hypothetical protein n=1 Tax=Bacillus cereus group sp. BC254 TaxID=3445328 RepID=UPI003F2177EA
MGPRRSVGAGPVGYRQSRRLRWFAQGSLRSAVPPARMLRVPVQVVGPRGLTRRASTVW